VVVQPWPLPRRRVPRPITACRNLKETLKDIKYYIMKQFITKFQKEGSRLRRPVRRPSLLSRGLERSKAFSKGLSGARVAPPLTCAMGVRAAPPPWNKVKSR
jgi:hypothetical protein